MIKIRLFMMFALALILAPLIALASTLPAVPDLSLGDGIAFLVTNWKTYGWLGAGIGVTTIATQVLKLWGDFKLKRFVVLLVAIAYNVLVAITQKWGAVEILVAVLVTWGGAVSAYEALKGAGVFPSKK